MQCTLEKFIEQPVVKDYQLSIIIELSGEIKLNHQSEIKISDGYFKHVMIDRTLDITTRD